MIFICMHIWFRLKYSICSSIYASICYRNSAPPRDFAPRTAVSCIAKSRFARRNDKRSFVNDVGPSGAGECSRIVKTGLHQPTSDGITEAFILVVKMSFFLMLIRKFSYVGVNKMVNNS